MSFSATLLQQTPTLMLPFAHLLTGMVQLILLGGVLMYFRPLLVGIVRALVLVVRPRPTKDELAARRKLRDAKRAAPTPASAAHDAAEVHALGTR